MEEKVIYNHSEVLIEDQNQSKTSENLKQKISKDDPVLKYNYVIDRYNTEESQFEKIALDFMPLSSLYNFMWKSINHPVKIIFLLIALTIPLFGFILYLCLLMAFIHHSLCMNLWKQNNKKVSNPFEYMVFSPELCEKMKTINRFFEIQVKGIHAFGNMIIV